MPPPPPRIRLLGPITIGTTRLGAPKLACVLAALALRPGTPVAQPELIDRVWDGDPPDAVLNVLYSYVARLRTALKPIDGAAIRRAGSHGYVLEIEPTDIDLHAVRALREEAATRPAEALELFRQACDLVGDDALVGLSGRWADETRTALAAERLELLTARYTAELDAGQHTAVLGELAAINDAEPLAEPIAELLMLAYYRSGRPADALARFESIRVRLRHELGADPSQPLRDLHLQILNQDPALDLSTAPIQLPSDISGFTGRLAELKTLNQLADPAAGAPLAAVVGPGGAGKTALAVHWGHSMVDRFPGGLLYLNLHGFDEGEIVQPREALGRLLLAMNTPVEAVSDDVDAAAELFRATTADRRVLVILDNARNAEQVRPLLPGAGSFTIVTSRDRLTGLIAVNGARPVPVGLLGKDESVELLTRILGAERVLTEPKEADRLAELCGHLALALRIAAAHVASEPTLRIADYVAELERRDRLDVLAVDGDPAATVTANLELSYRVLDEDARDLFARLGMLPGEDFAEELITSVSGASETDTLRALRRLVTAHLVEQHRPRRYRIHDLVRLYAARTGHRELSEPDRTTLIDSFIEWHHDRAYQPIADEETNVFLACETLQDHPKLWRLVVPLRNTVNEGRFLSRVHQVLDLAARQAERHRDDLGLFRMTSLKANSRRSEGDLAAAIEIGRRALALAEALTDRERVVAGGNLGIYLCEHGDLTGSAAAFVRAVDLAAATGNVRSQLLFNSSMIQVLLRLGRFDEAETYVRKAEALEGNDDPARAIRLGLSNAELQLHRGDFEAAMATADAALALAHRGESGHLDLWCIQVQAQIHLHAGRAEAARDAFEEELRLAHERNMFAFEPELWIHLADTLVELGAHREAGDFIAKARATTWATLSKEAQTFTNLVLAAVHNGLGEHQTALSLAHDAADAFAAMPWPARHELALLELAAAHAGLGEPDTAHEHRTAADRIAAPINRLRRHH